MSDERHARARELFLIVLDQHPAKREAYLAEACGGDDELYREVASLLLHHQEDDEAPTTGGLGDSKPGAGMRSDEPQFGEPRSDEPRSDEPRSDEPRSDEPWPDEDRKRFAPGQVFAGRYRIADELGRGGMGEVYRAHDLVLDRPVALKFLPDAGARYLEHLRNEVRMALEVTHPNVCRVYDFGQADGETYLTMEYIDGENLASLLARIGRLSHDKLLDVAHQLCAGLAAAHAKGVLHRDLKPANIMIDGRGQARITDFGIAGQIAAAENMSRDKYRIFGTPAYMAPEQLSIGQTSVQSDLYALGLVLHEMATGRPVFHAETPAGYAELHRTTTPTPPSRQVSHLEPRLENVILRCLEKDPADRPASVREVAAGLPGADHLRLALEAGQTPSPEMVAAARTDEGLRPAAAAALLATLALFLAAALALADRAYPERENWAAKPPAVLVERAEAILESIGYNGGEGAEEDGDCAWGFFSAGIAEDELFWVRQSPERLVPSSLWAIIHPRIDYDDPPPLEHGMLSLVLDSGGRLVELRVVSEDAGEDENGDEDEDRARKVDWAPLLAAAGTAVEELEAVRPGTPPVFADQRMAWKRTAGSVGDHLEAAALGGRPVYFQIRRQQEEPEESTSPDWDRLWFWYLAGQDGFQVLMVLGAIVLAWINLRAGRGDMQGARRLAVFVLVMNALAWVLLADYLPHLIRWQLAVGWMLMEAVVAWLAYIALEPVVRRWWPRALISWSRLLRGRPRDPLVGRSLLIGAAVGAGWTLLTQIDRLAAVGLGLEASPQILIRIQLEAASSGRLVLAEILSSLIEAVNRGVLDLFLLVGLRVVLRRWWLAVLVFVLPNVALETLQGAHPALSWLILGTGISVVSAWVLVRFGLLAYSTALFCYLVLTAAPLTLNFDAWYAETGLFVLALVAGIGVFGAWAALAGRPFVASLVGDLSGSRESR